MSDTLIDVEWDEMLAKRRRELTLVGWRKTKNLFRKCCILCEDVQFVGKKVYFKKGAGVLCITCGNAAGGSSGPLRKGTKR
jgi:hypothetical protein